MKRQGKARCAGNGYSLGKRRNAVMALHGGSLRARRRRAICGVALAWKGWPFSRKRALHLTRRRLAGRADIDESRH